MTIKTALLASAMLAIAVPAAAQVATPTPTPDAPAAAPETPAAAAEAAAPAPAAAAAPATPAKVHVAVGKAVLDANGGAVGTVSAVNGDVAVVDTGTVKASIPSSSFAESEKGLHISMTKAQLEAAAQGAQAGSQQALAASLTPGTAVSDPSGGAVGKVDSIDGDYVIVATAKSKVKLPKTAFAKGPNGAVIGMTLAQLEAAAKGAAKGS